MRVSNIKYDGDCETYQIHGGEAISIDLKKGDSVEIVDVEGDQKCSVLAFDSKKTSALSSLNWKTNSNNSSNKVSLDSCSEMLRAILDSNKIKPKDIDTAELFQDSSPADTRQYLILIMTSCVCLMQRAVQCKWIIRTHPLKF